MNETIEYGVVLCLFLLLIFLCLLSKYLHKTQPQKIISQDLVTDKKIPTMRFYSKKYNISGKPDEIKKDGNAWIPYEIKRTEYKGRVYSSHILQLAAYCLLIEEHTGICPSYGIIEYNNHKEKILFTQELRRNLLTQIKKMREEDPLNNDLPPICNDYHKCKHCGYAYFCHTGQKRLL